MGGCGVSGEIIIKCYDISWVSIWGYKRQPLNRQGHEVWLVRMSESQNVKPLPPPRRTSCAVVIVFTVFQLADMVAANRVSGGEDEVTRHSTKTPPEGFQQDTPPHSLCVYTSTTMLPYQCCVCTERIH